MTQQRSSTRTEQKMRLPGDAGQTIDRSRVLRFTWNGKQLTGHPGDTIASALAANGVTLMARSMKYHRPRGILTCSMHDPNCMVQIGNEPNVRGGHRLLEDGMEVAAQDTWPSLNFDVKEVNRLAGRMLGSGFYYKTFMKPAFLWPTYQKVLRRFVHAGSIAPDDTPAYYDKRDVHPDVLVAGGGPAGISAAIAAARAGSRVLLVEEEHELGGHLRWDDPSALAELLAELAAVQQDSAHGIEVMTNSEVLARYDQNWIPVVQRSLPGIPERLVKARARTLVVAAGLIERPYIFEGNDTPGVMLSTAARRLINLYGVRPGERAVVLTANASGDAAVEDLRRAGVEVVGVVDARAGEDVVRVSGHTRVKQVELADGRTLDADLLITATGWTAPTSLLNMAGDVPYYEPRAARFLPGGQVSSDVLATGGMAGDGTLQQLRQHATAVGTEAARRAAIDRRHDLEATPTADASAAPQVSAEEISIPPLPIDEHPELFRSSTHGVIDYSEDVSSKDIYNAVREGYDSAELAKRYTTATMGPIQGKLELINTIACIADATGKTIAQTGTTTWRPMYVPISLGALAGRNWEPVRYSPMQSWHEQRNAKPLIAGQWIRPDHYGDPAAEVRAVREAVGIIDITPIGKLDLHGPDVPKLLNLLYVNKWSNLPVGKVRYGVMCDEDGVVMDDGVTARLGEDRYLMSTTSSGAGSVWNWLEQWLQTSHPEWQVHVTPVTTGYASINVSGPRSRELVSRLTEGVDLSADAFPYMEVRTGRVAGVDDCVLMRLGFTGELSYELHVPASYGLHVWEALIEHGKDLGVRPFGVEAQRILRLEKGHLIVGQDTDGLTKAYSAGLDWAVKLDKPDFVGKPELSWQHQDQDGLRLVAIQPDDPRVVPDEASQIVTPSGKRILGRITSSRMSPTLNRSICLGQVEQSIARPGTAIQVRLPDGTISPARVMEQLAHFDPSGERQRMDTPTAPLEAHRTPVAHGPIATGHEVSSLADWQVDSRRSSAALRLADVSPLAKIAVRGTHDGPLAAALSVGFGRTNPTTDGELAVGSGPGEWLILGAPGEQDKLHAELSRVVDSSGEFGTVVDLTHGRAMFRLTGEHSEGLLAKVCGIDLADDFVPNHSALRTSVAKVATDLVRHDVDGVPSYFLHCERSSGGYLFDALLDAGQEFEIDVDGCASHSAL